MKPELRIQTRARQQSAEAFDWLETESAGLGVRFLERLEACFAALVDNPYGYATEFEEFRCAPVRPFKYLVYYRLVENTVIVHRIVHSSRDQDRIMRELTNPEATDTKR